MIEHLNSFIEIVGLCGAHAEFHPEIKFLGSINDSDRKGRIVSVKTHKEHKVFFVGLNRGDKKKTIELIQKQAN